MHNLPFCPQALITGGARRIGAQITRTLHQQGYSVIIHYRHSKQDAEALAAELNNIRECSASIVQADLNNMASVKKMAEQVRHTNNRLSLLVNNASSFYPTALADSTQQQWDDLINSNLRAAYFLIAELSGSLKQQSGVVINIIDIHAQRGLIGYPIYSIAKAGLEMMTRTLAKELAPEVRINGVSPGPIMWPEAEASLSEQDKHTVLSKTPLARSGSPNDIANAVFFLATADFITGQVLAVDGGRSLYT